jgi:hypothetical protein
VWFNTSGGSAVDPAPGGSTAVVVALSTGATAAQVATAVAAAIDALAGYVSTASGATVTVTNASVGFAQAAHDGGVPTGFTFGVTTAGDSEVDAGYMDGDIEPAMPEDLVDIMANQTGTNVLSQLRSGKQVEVTMNFQETSTAQLKRIFRNVGNAYTPAGANATEIAGMGPANDFTQTLTQAKRLRLHPVTLGASDRSRDLTFHKAYPLIDSLAFSGENKLLVPLTFKCYPKASLNSKIQYFVYGDASQSLA